METLQSVLLWISALAGIGAVILIAVICWRTKGTPSLAPSPAPPALSPAPSPTPSPTPAPSSALSNPPPLAWYERTWKEIWSLRMVIPPILGVTFLTSFITPVQILNSEWRIWILVLVALTVWVFGRWEVVSPNEIGVKTLLGVVIQKLREGPTIVPLWIFRLIKLPAKQFSIQIGSGETEPTMNLLDGIASAETTLKCQEELLVNFADPQSAKWTVNEDEDKLVLQKDPDTIRKASERKEQFKDDPLNTRITGKMRVTFLVQIDPDSADEFVRTIESPDNAIFELNELARAVVGRWCGKRTAAFVSGNTGLLGREILHNAEDLVGDKKPSQITLPNGSLVNRRRDNVNPNPWGLDIVKTEVHAPTFSEEVQKSLDGYAATVRAADAEKKKREREGEGAAAAVKSMNEELKSDAAKYALAMEAAVKMVKEANVVLSGDNPVALATAQIKAAIDAFQPPKKS